MENKGQQFIRTVVSEFWLKDEVHHILDPDKTKRLVFGVTTRLDGTNIYSCMHYKNGYVETTTHFAAELVLIRQAEDPEPQRPYSEDDHAES